MRRAPARPVRACFVRSCCSVVLQEHDLRATPVQCNAKQTLSSHFTLHSSHPSLHTSHLHFALDTSPHLKSCELFSPHLSSSHLIPSLLMYLSKFFSTVFISSEHWSAFLISLEFVSTHLSCPARQKALTVREKSLAQKMAQKVFAHRHLGHRCNYIQKPFRNTLYYKACTKHFPVILCTTKLARSTSQYYFVLQSLNKALPTTTLLQSLCKALPSTTLLYKACTKHFQELLCTTRLAQSIPSTTLYYKACTNYFPVPVVPHKAVAEVSKIGNL